MDKSKVGERLRTLATDSPNRPDAARLRDIFEEVEVALKAKVPQAEVLSELHKAGFTMTMGGFKSALQRIRKEREKAGGDPKKSTEATTSDVISNATKTAEKPVEELGAAEAGGADGTSGNSNRPPPLLSEDKGVWGKLKPSPVDGTVDLKQK